MIIINRILYTKKVHSRLLNILGISVIRTLISKLLCSVSNARRYLRYGKSDLSRHGMVIFSCPYSDSQRINLSAIYDEYIRQAQPLPHMACHKRFIIRPSDQSFARANTVVLPESIKSLLLPHLGSNGEVTSITFSEIRHGDPDSVEDYQKMLHRDSYFDTYKLFIYLADVTAREGPFTYILGSHRLTIRRLLQEYFGSLDIRPINDNLRQSVFSFRGWLSPDTEKLSSFVGGLGDLALVNTFGWHARGDGSIDAVRKSITVGFKRRPMPGILDV
jgi:hypothetical protein